MSNENRDEITFAGLQRFLARLGFEQPVRTGHALAFQHAPSGAVIVLSIPADGRSVRAADLLSVATRLESQGLLRDSELVQFKSGRLPKAS